MRRFQPFLKFVACLVMVAFCGLNITAGPAGAALVGTAEVLEVREADEARATVVLFLERQDVADHLQAMGVDRDEAQARVKTMTPEEIIQLADKIEQMPAGEGALGFIIGVAFVALVTLIITDIIGITDVFTFIKKR